MRNLTGCSLLICLSFSLLAQQKPYSKNFRNSNLDFSTSNRTYSFPLPVSTINSNKLSTETIFLCQNAEGAERYTTKLTTSPEDLFSPSFAKYDTIKRKMFVAGDYGTLSPHQMERRKNGWNPLSCGDLRFEGIRIYVIDLSSGRIEKTKEFLFTELMDKELNEKDSHESPLCMIKDMDLDEKGTLYLLGVVFAHFGRGDDFRHYDTDGSRATQTGGTIIGDVDGILYMSLGTDMLPRKTKYHHVRQKKLNDWSLGRFVVFYSEFMKDSPGLYISPLRLDMRSGQVLTTSLFAFGRDFNLTDDPCLITAVYSKGKNAQPFKYYSMNLLTGEFDFVVENKGTTFVVFTNCGEYKYD
jgi:hypothetical protein